MIGHPVLLTKAPLNPRTNRATAAQIFFETFNVPALFTSIQAVLSLYASGRTTGIVLDSGDAGRDVTENLQVLLRKAGAVFHTLAEKKVVCSIKEKTCLDTKKEEKEWAGDGAAKVEEYRLPDGHLLKFGSERLRAAGILFDPEIIGLEYPGIYQIAIAGSVTFFHFIAFFVVIQSHWNSM
ncbi:Centractin [Rhizina undulata]